MTTPHNEHIHEAPAALIQHRERHEELFGPHCLDPQIDRGLALALEISLYTLCISFITVLVLLPGKPESIQSLFPNTRLADPVGFVLWIKMTLFIAALVPLFWGLHLSDKRLKGRLLSRRKTN